jgi:TonB family protein
MNGDMKLNMRRIITLFSVFGILLTGVFVSSVDADTWRLPKKEKYHSPNKKFYFEVTPKNLESQLKYFQDKVDGNKNAGALDKTKENRAIGAFYARRFDGGYSRKSKFFLSNEVSPVSAIVSNNGEYVVTFDNWHGVGYGDDVVVIYRSDGTMVKKFALEDLLTEGDIETFSRSTSSMSWGGEHKIDEASNLLVLKVVANGKSSWEDTAKFHELKVDLATGQPLEPKRDLFPQLRVFSSIDFGIATETSGSSPNNPLCSSSENSFDLTGATRIPSERFYSNAKERPLPPYPAAAKAVRATGKVIVEVLISETGDVICARDLSGHPLLRTMAANIVLKWKFEAIEVSDKPTKTVGTVAINFMLTEKNGNPNNALSK